jgi:hypothetical protein
MWRGHRDECRELASRTETLITVSQMNLADHGDARFRSMQSFRCLIPRLPHLEGTMCGGGSLGSELSNQEMNQKHTMVLYS